MNTDAERLDLTANKIPSQIHPVQATPQNANRPATPAEPALPPRSENDAKPKLSASAPPGKPLPITLSSALSLADSSPLDVQIASERVRIAAAQQERAEALWFPDLNIGVDYFRHDGQIQDIVGTVFTTSRSAFMLGAGPQASIELAEAVFTPLAARQRTRASQAEEQTTRNDTTLAVAEAYFGVQQARGEVAGSLDALRRAEDLVSRTEKLAPALAPTVEINRARVEAARRRQGVESAYERWQVASADLIRLLRLEPGTVVEPAEPPTLTVDLVQPETPIDELMSIGLTYRPELAAHQALVQAALVRVKQEQRRPFYPTIGIRGVGSNQSALAGGYFGGGINDEIGNFGPRFSIDLQAVWQLQNLGFGNRAAIREQQSQSRQALLELLRMQDLIVAEVSQAHAQLQRAAKRKIAAADAVSNAVQTVDANLEGLGQTKRFGEQLVLVFRPQEAVAAVTTLDMAYREYFQAVSDYNRAQFRLYRALGHPASAICQMPLVPAIESTPPTDKPRQVIE